MTVPGSTHFPLSGPQHGLWLDLQIRPSHPERFNIATSAHITGVLDPHLFQQAIELIVQRHGALRARFVTTATGEPIQQIAPVATGFYEHMEFETLAAAEQWVERDLAVPFTSLQAPLCRFVLCRVGREEWLWYAKYHHLIIDGQGLALLRQDLCATYAALLQEIKPAEITDLYAEYLLDEASYRASSAYVADEAFWTALHSTVDAPQMRSSRPARATPELNLLSAQSRELAAPISNWVACTARESHVESSDVLIAAAALFLSCISGERTITIGLPVHGRSKQYQHLIAFCSNVLPLRLSIERNGMFHELVSSVSEQVRAALEHRRYRYEDLKQKLGSIGDTDLVPAVVNIMRFPSAMEFHMGAARARIVIRAAGPLHGLSFLFYGRRESPELSVAIDATSGWGDAWQLKTIRASFLSYLEHLAESPTKAAPPKDALSDADRHLVERWGRGSTLHIPHATFVHLFSTAAQLHPHRLAVQWSEGSLTYRALDQLSNSLAKSLRESIEPSSVVAVYMQRGPEAIIALLGILKAGCVYLPIDPENPLARVRRMLDDAAVQCVLVEQHRLDSSRASFSAGVARGISLAEPISEIKVTLGVSPTQRAYIIYTSGSTGEPKGAINHHAAFANLVVAQAAAFGVTCESRVIQLARLGFDASLSETGMTLICGACLYIAPASLAEIAADLSGLLERERITTATIPPALLALLPWSELPDLQTLIVAGEACPLDLARRWSRGRRFINAYGPTETCVCATWGDFTPDSTLVSIGRPLANTRVKVVNESGQLAPPGFVGELWIGGAPVGDGYLRDPALTDARFVPGTFVGGDARWYRSGDLVRWLPDGTLDFIGRLDAQAKVRGFRVEPGEIEAALRSHPSITGSAVIVRSRDGRMVIDAYVTNSSDKHTHEDFRQHVRSLLPDFMMPSTISVLHALPLSLNGKLNRDALPLPTTTASQRSDQNFTATQTRVARILEEALGVQPIGLTDNFFDLGGDSLLAIQVITELRRDFAVELQADRFFLNPSIEAIAVHIDALLTTNNTPHESSASWREFFQ